MNNVTMHRLIKRGKSRIQPHINANERAAAIMVKRHDYLGLGKMTTESFNSLALLAYAVIQAGEKIHAAKQKFLAFTPETAHDAYETDSEQPTE